MGRRPGVVKEETTKLFIYNLLTDKFVYFHFIPEDYSEGESADFEPQVIRGRSTPFFGYSSSGPRTGSLNFKVHDDYCVEPSSIVETVNFLRSLAYPEYGANYVLPPRAVIKMGSYPYLKIIIGSVGVTWQLPMRDGYYIMADISIDYQVCDDPYSASEIY